MKVEYLKALPEDPGKVSQTAPAPRRRPWAGIAGVLAALVLFLWSGPILRRLDPTAGVLDAGVLGMLPLAALLLAMAKLAAWAVYGMMVESFNQLNAWRRSIAYGCLYLSYFWGMVWLMASLL